MKKILLLFNALFFTFIVLCQEPVNQWTSVIGGSKDETIPIIMQASDTGYFVIAKTRSSNGDVSKDNNYSILVSKINKNGKKAWAITLNNFSRYKSAIVTKEGIIISYNNYKNLFADDHFYIKMITNNGVEVWTKEIWQAYEYMDNGEIIQQNDTTFIIGGISSYYNENSTERKVFADLIYFNSKGSVKKEQYLELGIETGYFMSTPLGIWQTLDESSYLLKFHTIQKEGVAIAYSVRKDTANKAYFYTNLVFVDSYGKIILQKREPGIFHDLIVTNSGEVLLFRKVWPELNIRDLSLTFDKYSSDGNILLSNISTIDLNYDLEVVSSFITRSNEIILSNGQIVRQIDSIACSTLFYEDKNNNQKNIISVNVIQSSLGDYYLQTIAEPIIRETGEVINKIKIVKFDKSRKIFFDKELWNIKDGTVIIFSEIENEKFLIVSKNNFGNNLALYICSIIDNNGNLLSSISCYGPTGLIKLLNHTLDNGVVIAGQIFKKESSIADYHGGSDIMLLKLGFNK